MNRLPGRAYPSGEATIPAGENDILRAKATIPAEKATGLPKRDGMALFSPWTLSIVSTSRSLDDIRRRADSRFPLAPLR